MGSAPRRIVVVLDGPPTPAWQERALATLSSSSALEIGELRLAGPCRRGLTRRAHAAIERHLFALGPDALAPVSLERADVGTRVGPGTGAEPGTGTELVVWLSERPPPAGERRELLYLRHGRLREPAEDAFRRAALRGRPCVETEALLRRQDETVLVERTVSGARPFSTTLSRDKALWKLAALACRAAERAPGLDAPAPPDDAISAPPSTAELIARAPWAWLRIVAARLIFRRPWQIRVRAEGREPTSGWSRTPPLVRWKPGHLYADPFLFARDGRHHLFCEELPPGSNRAVISHTELHPDGSLSDAPVPVLEAPYHLSYPFVFEHQGEVLMIPETSSQGRVELYRASDFPSVWRRESVLLDGVIASDATLLAHDGRLWLFVGVAVAHATMLDELHLFFSEDPAGPWRAHPRNPVVSDVRCARPAGAIQRWGSRLVRPGQDGSRRYGGAISFREIDVLSVEEYAEHEIARLDPGDLGDARATHTYASDGSFEAVDLRRRELGSGLSLAQLGGRLARAAGSVSRARRG
jgi:hypothetical protein